jgi:plastocyanin
MAPTTIEAVIENHTFAPDRWRVVSGTELTLTLTNLENIDRDWVLLSWPVDGEYDEQEEANVIVRAAVPAGQAITVQFTAPAAPGQYDVVCSLPGCLEEGLRGRLIVYQSVDYLP